MAEAAAGREIMQTYFSDLGCGSSGEASSFRRHEATDDGVLSADTSIRSTAEPAFSDRSYAVISQLEARWKGYEFPFVENPDRTWENAVGMLKASLEDGFHLRRRDVNRAGFCLKHCTPESGDNEHSRPLDIENELTAAEIYGQEDLIRVLHEGRVETTETHKSLQFNGKRLGVLGKQMVRNIRTKIEREPSAADNAVYNDAQLFVKQLQQSDCFLRFKVDGQSRITCIAWAHRKQELNALKYHSVIIQDNTFNTNMYKYHLALIVVVDSENHTQLAMQALVSHDPTDDFQFIFDTFKELCGGAHPKVIFTDADKAASAAIEQVYPHTLHKFASGTPRKAFGHTAAVLGRVFFRRCSGSSSLQPTPRPRP